MKEQSLDSITSVKIGPMQDDDKERILELLAKEPTMVVANAYLYAKNFCKYGVDITKELTTATQLSDQLYRAYLDGYREGYEKVKIEDLTPVTSQPKTGHWNKMVLVYDVLSGKYKRMPYTDEDEKFENVPVYICKCGCEAVKPHNYCPDCGLKMQEVSQNKRKGG